MDPESPFRLALIALFMSFTLVRAGHLLKSRGARKPPVTTQTFREGTAVRTLRFLCFFLLLGGILAYTLVLITPVPYIDSAHLPLPALLRWTGVVLALLALAGFHRVHLALGRLFSAELELTSEHRLLTQGPYARVRHPLYLCLFLFFGGAACASANALIFIGALANVLWIAWRVRREEVMLEERFGDEFRLWRARTGAFWPR